MSLFLFTFFTLYGSIHLYFFLKFKNALAPVSPWVLVPFALLLLLMLLSPVLIHVIEAYRPDGFTRVFARTGYCWMGFLFLFFCLSLTADLYSSVAHLVRLFSRGFLLAPIPATRGAFLLSACLAALICLYGVYEARHLKIEHLVVPSGKIPQEINRFRVVQISDLHLGITSGPAQTNRIIAAIGEAKPDLLVCTGDLMDGQPDSFTPQLAPFRQINPPFGKYAVTGNHEFYVGLDRAIKWLEWSGFKVLRGERVNVTGFLNLAGVDDHESFQRHPAAGGMGSDILAEPPDGRFTLFLKHRPLIEPQMSKIADLQLSGHTHRGQIFPFGLITRLFFPYHSGFYQFENGFQLYVSRGTGTWGPPIRFLSPPEITIIDLVPAQGKKQGGE
jgi:predicted MPP superfamily phosphohydrolase